MVSFEHHGVRGDDRPAVDDDTMQHDGTVPDQAPRLDRAPLEVHEVTDHAVVADDRGVLVRWCARRSCPARSCAGR